MFQYAKASMKMKHLVCYMSSFINNVFTNLETSTLFVLIGRKFPSVLFLFTPFISKIS
jgi:hypothetical protein